MWGKVTIPKRSRIQFIWVLLWHMVLSKEGHHSFDESVWSVVVVVVAVAGATHI